MYIGLRVKYPLFLSGFNETWRHNSTFSCAFMACRVRQLHFPLPWPVIHNLHASHQVSLVAEAWKGRWCLVITWHRTYFHNEVPKHSICSVSTCHVTYYLVQHGTWLVRIFRHTSDTPNPFLRAPSNITFPFTPGSLDGLPPPPPRLKFLRISRVYHSIFRRVRKLSKSDY